MTRIAILADDPTGAAEAAGGGGLIVTRSGGLGRVASREGTVG
jgi:hypothetical protein